MAKYRKLPVEVEAFKYGVDEFPPWFSEAIECHKVVIWDNVLTEIDTLEGWMTVRNGDYVIQGVKGEIYPCKSDIFEETYERV